MNYELIAQQADEEDSKAIVETVLNSVDKKEMVSLLDGLLKKADRDTLDKYADIQRKRISVRYYEQLYDKLQAKRNEIIADLTTEGFFIEEIEVLPGLDVSFKSLIDDEQAEVFDYLGRLKDITDVQIQRGWSRRSLAHALCRINGEKVGGVAAVNYRQIRAENDPIKAMEALSAVADKRMSAIASMASGIVDKLLEVNVTYASVVNAIVNEGDVVAEIKK